MSTQHAPLVAFAPAFLDALRLVASLTLLTSAQTDDTRAADRAPQRDVP